jgi:hypothetical protein
MGTLIVYVLTSMAMAIFTRDGGGFYLHRDDTDNVATASINFYFSDTLSALAYFFCARRIAISASRNTGLIAPVFK